MAFSFNTIHEVSEGFVLRSFATIRLFCDNVRFKYKMQHTEIKERQVFYDQIGSNTFENNETFSCV